MVLLLLCKTRDVVLEVACARPQAAEALPMSLQPVPVPLSSKAGHAQHVGDGVQTPIGVQDSLGLRRLRCTMAQLLRFEVITIIMTHEQHA